MIINDIENEFMGDPGSKAAFNLAVYMHTVKVLIFLLKIFVKKSNLFQRL